MHGILTTPFPFAHGQIIGVADQLEFFVDGCWRGLLKASLSFVRPQELRRNILQRELSKGWKQMI